MCIISEYFVVVPHCHILIPDSRKEGPFIRLHSVSSDKGVWSDPGSVSVHSRPPLTDVVMQCHHPPLDWNMEEERLIQRMATRGGRERGRGK